MEVLVSIVSILVMVTVTFILLYQNARLRDSVASDLQSIVKEINDSTYYSYQYDKKQESDIKQNNDNIVTNSTDIKNLTMTIKNDYQSKKQMADGLKTNDLQVGDQAHVRPGTGDGFSFLLDSNNTFQNAGLATGKLYTNDGAYLTGDTYAQKLFVTNTLNVTGASGEFNGNGDPTIFADVSGKNMIRGDTDIYGNVSTAGDLMVGRNLTLKGSLQTMNNNPGPIVKSTDGDGVQYGWGQYKGKEMRFFNGSTNAGSITFGTGLDEAYDPIIGLNAMDGKSMSIGNRGLSVTQVAKKGTWSPSADEGDVVFRSEGDDNRIIMQNGVTNGAGLILKNSTVGIGGDPAYGILDVYGNMTVRGSEMSLGYETGANTGQSRALAKGDDGDLIVNYQNDFPAGVSVQSDVSVTGNKCIEMGKGVEGKEVDAGKICYGMLSDNLDIVGSGVPGSTRKVKVWDSMESDQVVTNKFCMGNVCIKEADLSALTTLIRK